MNHAVVRELLFKPLCLIVIVDFLTETHGYVLSAMYLVDFKLP